MHPDVIPGLDANRTPRHPVFVRPSQPAMRWKSDVHSNVLALTASPAAVTSLGELLHAAPNPQDQRKLIEVGGVGTLAEPPERLSEH